MYKCCNSKLIMLHGLLLKHGAKSFYNIAPMKKVTLGLFMFILLTLNACNKPQSFEYREVTNLKLQHLGFYKTSVSMDIVYYNPNNFSINLKNVDCQVYLNEKYLGHYLLDSTIHIAQKSVFIVPASVSFDMMDVIKKGFNILINKEALIGIKGTTRVGRCGLFFNVPIQYETKVKLPLL